MAKPSSPAPFQNQNFDPKKFMDRKEPPSTFGTLFGRNVTRSKPAPKPTGTLGIFGDKNYVPRRDVRSYLRKDSGAIPGETGIRSTRRYNKKERAEFEKMFSGDRYYVKRSDAEKKIKYLEKERWKAPSNEKWKFDQRINYFKRLVRGQ
jgi:hypothetical protein